VTENWKKFKEKNQSPNGDKEPEGIMMYGSYMCQFCGEMCWEGKYFPVDSVLSYKCSKGHLSILEKFSLQ
jgi:hypothetical protein